MGFLNKDTFICLDCETTGLDPKTDRIIEIAVAKFNFTETLESFESLVDPECAISETSQAIHHISQEMVKGQPKMIELLPQIVKLVDKHMKVGHGVWLDLLF